MHVLHVETGRHLYGGALQVLYLLEGLKKEGIKNTLLCPQGSEIGLKAANSADVHGIALAGELDPRLVLSLLRAFRADPPSLLHVHSRRGADLWGGVAAMLTRTPAIVTRRVDNPENPLIVRAKYRCFERVIAISEGIRQVLLSEGVPSDKIILVPSGLDSKQYAFSGDKVWFCKEFGLNLDNRLIGTIAQLIPRKGHRFIIQAAPEILRRFPDTHFFFFGKGPLEKELRDLCELNGIQSNVHFAGFRKDLDRILPCLDLVVHPASMEGLGVSLLQAAASGVPIVASRVGGIPEIVNNGVNGYLVEGGRVEEIVHSVMSLLSDPTKAERFGQAGREIVSSRFSTTAMVYGNLEVYRSLMKLK